MKKSGLHAEQVRIIARTRDWLRYEVPDHFIRRDARGHYKGQKQIWFLLQLLGHDSDLNLRATDHPEFDAWRWNDYWVPLDVVIEFKRDVYEMALTELARFLPRGRPSEPLPALRHAGGRPLRRADASRGCGTVSWRTAGLGINAIHHAVSDVTRRRLKPCPASFRRMVRKKDAAGQAGGASLSRASARRERSARPSAAGRPRRRSRRRSGASTSRSTSMPGAISISVSRAGSPRSSNTARSVT